MHGLSHLTVSTELALTLMLQCYSSYQTMGCAMPNLRNSVWNLSVGRPAQHVDLSQMTRRVNTVLTVLILRTLDRWYYSGCSTGGCAVTHSIKEAIARQEPVQECSGTRGSSTLRSYHEREHQCSTRWVQHRNERKFSGELHAIVAAAETGQWQSASLGVTASQHDSGITASLLPNCRIRQQVSILSIPLDPASHVRTSTLLATQLDRVFASLYIIRCMLVAYVYLFVSASHARKSRGVWPRSRDVVHRWSPVMAMVLDSTCHGLRHQGERRDSVHCFPGCISIDRFRSRQLRLWQMHALFYCA